MNMISVEDLNEEEEIFKVKDDLLTECKNYGEIISIEIPRPDDVGIASFGVGKIFVKFNHIIAAKQARYKLSGRKYNGRTVVVSFYPEHYFDIKEFSII
jgi:splicing factor U2AF 65 kDa subunit